MFVSHNLKNSKNETQKTPNLAKIVIFDSDATSNSHRFMYFRYKDKSFDENTPNDPKNLTLKKKIEFVCFPPFYDPKNKNWSILVGFGQNRKFLGNRQTMKKNYSKKTDKLVSNKHSLSQQYSNRTKVMTF